jgi:hypothetical protein
MFEVRRKGALYSQVPKQKNRRMKRSQKGAKKLQLNSTAKGDSDDSNAEISIKSVSEYYCFFSQPIYLCARVIPDPL